MKINSIGIEAYRHMAGKQQVNNRSEVDIKRQDVKSEQIQIPVQTDKVGSDLSVKLKPGTFVDMLSSEEKQAVNILFKKYADAAESVLSKDGATVNNQLGRHVDVKL
jgi:hypothetical protein